MRSRTASGSGLVVTRHPDLFRERDHDPRRRLSRRVRERLRCRRTLETEADRDQNRHREPLLHRNIPTGTHLYTLPRSERPGHRRAAQEPGRRGLCRQGTASWHARPSAEGLQPSARFAELQIVERGVEAAGAEELVVRAFLHDLSLADDEDAVRLADRR